MLEIIKKHPILMLVLTVLAMLCFSFPFLEISIMEARDFITAREMLEDGNWLLTTMNGEPRYQKPPLPTWLAAISGLIFGMKSLFAMRLPGILMVVILSITAYFFSKKLDFSKQHSLVNALVLTTSFYIVAIVIEAPWDIFTHSFMFLGLYYLFQCFVSSKSSLKLATIAGLFIGLSILCKGPVSLYVLFLPFIIAFALTIKFENFKSKIFSILVTIIVSLIVGGWWYAYVRYSDPETFIEIANRETGNWSNYNVRPFYYYWSFFTQSGIWTIPAFISLLYPYLKTRVSNLKVYRFTLLWTLFALLLLSIIPEKKSRYLMPVLIPLALNIGFYLEYLFRRFKDLKDKRETIPVYFNFGLIALIGMLFGIAGYFYLKDVTSIDWFVFGRASLVLFFIGLLILSNLKRKRIEHVFYCTIFFVIAAFALVAPLSKSFISSNYNSIANLKEEKEDLNIYAFNHVSPEMIWHFGGKLIPMKPNDSVLNLPSENRFGMLANGISPSDQEILNDTYIIEKIDTFDLNLVAPDSKKHRGRLLSHFYILSKK